MPPSGSAITPPPPNSIPALSLSILHDLILDNLHDIALSAHTHAHTSRQICPTHNKPCRQFCSLPNKDIWGKDLVNGGKEGGAGGGGGSGGYVKCDICGREVAGSRFAPHLEKCLGLGGARRAASSSKKGSGTASPYTFATNSDASDDDFELSDASTAASGKSKKRKNPPMEKKSHVQKFKQASGGRGASPAVSERANGSGSWDGGGAEMERSRSEGTGGKTLPGKR
ncbi:SAGA-associated factor [Saitoella coloradoensis]